MFLPELNRRFTCKPREHGDLHRSLPAGLQLKDILCFEEPRVVQNDWTVRWRNRYFQIARQHEVLHLAGRSIIIRERLDGTLALIYRAERLRFKELPHRPRPVLRVVPPRPRGSCVPTPDHPWRKPLLVGGRLGAARWVSGSCSWEKI